jgi:hypothetical protein
MPIIRVTRKQIEAANKAREAALKKHDDFRRHEEERQRFEEALKTREAAFQKEFNATFRVSFSSFSNLVGALI